MKLLFCSIVFLGLSAGTADARKLKRPDFMDLFWARGVECPIHRNFEAGSVRNDISEVTYEEARSSFKKNGTRDWAALKATLKFSDGRWSLLEGDLSHCWIVVI